MSKQIGIITIGQAPRTDLIPEIRKFFTNEVKFIERGVLDSINKERLEQIKPEPGQTTLISRLKDGTPVTIAKEKILTIIQQIIDDFNKGQVHLIVLACTGEFKLFQSTAPIIYPDYLLNKVLQGIFRGEKRIGVILPLIEQRESIEKKWKSAGFQVSCAASSPYISNKQILISATNQLEQTGVDTIVLDCIGYTQSMKDIVKKHFTKNVILSRNIVFKNIAELIE